MAPTEDGIPIAEAVRRALAQMSPAERKVGRTLLAVYPVAGLESVTQLAQRAQVSPATVVRFAQRLGFDGWPGFQRALLTELDARTRSPLTLYTRRPTGGGDVLAFSLGSFRESLESTFAALPEAEFEAAVTLLADPRRRVLCTGGRFSQTLAYYLYAHLLRLRPGVGLITDAAGPRSDQLADVGRRDVLCAFDYRRYQADTVALARRAKAEGARVLLFTDPWLSPIAEFADHVLPASVEAPSPFDSALPALAVVEALVAGLVVRLGERAQERIERVDRMAQ